MDVLKVMATAIIAVMLALMLKEQKPYIATALIVLCTMYIFFFGMTYLDKIVTYVRVLYSSISTGDAYISIIFKITAISLVSSFTSGICIDSGMSAVASVVTFCAKAVCMCMTLPLIADFFRNIISVLP